MKTHDEKVEFERGYMHALIDVQWKLSAMLDRHRNSEVAFDLVREFRMQHLEDLIAKSDDRYDDLTKVEYETDPHFAEKDRMAQKSQDENDLEIHGRLY